MKFSDKFERDYSFYLQNIDFFNFDGVKDYYDKKGNNLIVHDENGVTAKEAFFIYDSQGKIRPTCEPKLLRLILRTKGSVNLHIKTYAEDRASGLLCKFEVAEIAKETNAPDWFSDAIEEQKFKYPLKAFPKLEICP